MPSIFEPFELVPHRNSNEVRLESELEYVTKERDTARRERNQALDELDKLRAGMGPENDDARAWRDYVRALDCAVAPCFAVQSDPDKGAACICAVADAIAAERKRMEGGK